MSRPTARAIVNLLSMSSTVASLFLAFAGSRMTLIAATFGMGLLISNEIHRWGDKP